MRALNIDFGHPLEIIRLPLKSLGLSIIMGGARLESDSPRAAFAACDSFAPLVLCGSAMASTAAAKIQAARAVSTKGPSLRCAWLRPTFAQPQHGCVVLLNTSDIETIVRNWSRMLGSVMHELSGWPNMAEQELDDESCRQLGFPERLWLGNDARSEGYGIPWRNRVGMRRKSSHPPHGGEIGNVHFRALQGAIFLENWGPALRGGMRCAVRPFDE